MAALVYGLIFSGGLFKRAELARADEFRQCDGWAIRWYVGLAPDNQTLQYDGNVPSVSVYSETGGFLGWDMNKYNGPLTEDDDWNICVRGYGSTERAAYIALSANGNTDAICLSAFVVTHPDGYMSTVTGDMPAQCGYATGYSVSTIGHARPKCMWLDGDYSYGNENGNGFMQGLSFHLRDFEPTEERINYYNSKPETLCNSEPLMYRHHKFALDSQIRVFEPPLEYDEGELDKDYEHIRDPSLWDWTDKKVLPPSKRAAKHLTAIPSFISHLFTRAPAATSIYDRFEGTIVRSNHTSHSAVTLCDTPSMHGPDFVSLQEQIFCDMKTREKYPVCDSSNAEGQGICFDLDENQLVASAVMTETAGYSPFLLPPVVDVPVRAYHDIQNWD